MHPFYVFWLDQAVPYKWLSVVALQIILCSFRADNFWRMKTKNLINSTSLVTNSGTTVSTYRSCLLPNTSLPIKSRASYFVRASRGVSKRYLIISLKIFHEVLWGDMYINEESGEIIIQSYKPEIMFWVNIAWIRKRLIMIKYVQGSEKFFFSFWQ